MKDVVAIDGPAGAGKSTVARLVAREIGYRYVDTGAMYRALTLLALRKGIPCDAEDLVAELAARARIIMNGDGPVPSVILDGEDVGTAIRQPEVSRHVSLVARIPAVRERLTELQRRMAAAGRVVMEGRDIGTVVLPHAEHKFFITASAEERARRRQRELAAAGRQCDLDVLAREIARRDFIDSTREVAPLRPAPDALVIDTTERTIDQVVEMIVREVRGK
ncbi:MAG: (d)CMP kinase [Thermoanaerobacterales bacterium]|nr:(d)CMP kinase [Bacillota bacterium]MDI6906307.1 (d)CMP kinase [Thermoanaerobacterales bacterium]